MRNKCCLKCWTGDTCVAAEEAVLHTNGQCHDEVQDWMQTKSAQCTVPCLPFSVNKCLTLSLSAFVLPCRKPEGSIGLSSGLALMPVGKTFNSPHVLWGVWLSCRLRAASFCRIWNCARVKHVWLFQWPAVCGAAVISIRCNGRLFLTEQALWYGRVHVSAFSSLNSCNTGKSLFASDSNDHIYCSVSRCLGDYVSSLLWAFYNHYCN